MHARTPLPVSRSRYRKGNSFEAAHAGTMPHGGEACNCYRGEQPPKAMLHS